jgi:hypothetical protein
MVKKVDCPKCRFYPVVTAHFLVTPKHMLHRLHHDAYVLALCFFGTVSAIQSEQIEDPRRVEWKYASVGKSALNDPRSACFPLCSISTLVEAHLDLQRGCILFQTHFFHQGRQNWIKICKDRIIEGLEEVGSVCWEQPTHHIIP